MWSTAGEQRHCIADTRHDEHGRGYVLTTCGQLIWPSRLDGRLPDPRVCLQCQQLVEGKSDVAPQRVAMAE